MSCKCAALSQTFDMIGRREFGTGIEFGIGTVGRPNSCYTNYRSKSMNTLHKDYGLQCYLCPFCRPINFWQCIRPTEYDTQYPNPVIVSNV